MKTNIWFAVIGQIFKKLDSFYCCEFVSTYFKKMSIGGTNLIKKKKNLDDIMNVV